MHKFVYYMYVTVINIFLVVGLIVMFHAMSSEAKAAPAKQRVSILKYYLCLANPTVVDKSLCHL